MTKRQKHIVLGCAVLALIGGVAFARVHDDDGENKPTELRWPAGKEQVYALTWTTKTTSRVMLAGAQEQNDPPSAQQEGVGTLDSNVGIDGDLVVSSYGKEGDELVLAARFENLTRAEVSALGKPLLPTMESARKELEGKSVEIFVKPSGEVARVRFHPQDPALFRYLMQAVVTELDFRVASPGAPASANLDGPSGRGPVKFSVASSGSRPRLITRTRERYDELGAWPVGDLPTQTLSNNGHVAIDPKTGTIEEVTETEKLEAARAPSSPQHPDVTSNTSFSLKKKATRNGAPPRRQGFEDVNVSALAARMEAGESDEARRARLEERTTGVTIDTIVDDLRVASAVPKGRSTRWGWLAMGYLELHPEKCNELVSKMESLDVQGKGLTLDLLVSTGTKEAQAAAIRAFADDSVVIKKGSPEESILFMRLGLITTPTPETADFVAARYAKAKEKDDTPVMRSSAIALGGIISAVAKTDRARARELDDALVMDLYAAKDVNDRAILVRALGNAALEEDALAIRLQSHDPEPDVRAAVATALRRFDSPLVRRTLLELIGDERVGVQLNALSSLDRRPIGAPELEELLQLVEKKKIHPTNLQSFVNLLVTRKDTPMGRAILDTLSKQPELDPHLRARVNHLRDGN